MLRKLSTLFIVLLAFSLIYAQNRTVLKPLGTTFMTKGQLQQLEVINKRADKSLKGKKQNHFTSQPLHLSGVKGTIDTISYLKSIGGTYNTNFGFFGQDVMAEWYVAPADLTIKAVGASIADDTGGKDVTVKIYKVGVDSGWTKTQMETNGYTHYWGYWPSAGDGFAEIAPFEDESTGPWVNVDGGANGPTSPIFVEDIWSDLGTGFPVTPVASNPGEYQWVQMSSLGFEPNLLAGEIFAIVYTHSGTTLDADRIGFNSEGATAPSPGGFKFYENGRLISGPVSQGGDGGWWGRAFRWDYAAIVDLTGDRPPVIADVTTLGTTLSTAPRTVSATITDDNPSGGPSGVASAVLQYSLDDGATFTDVSMTASGNNYSADIPGQPSGQKVVYKIMATDVQGNSSESSAQSYSVFAKTQSVLFIYNTADFSKGVATFFYLGDGTAEPVAHDFWSIPSDGTAELPQLLDLYDFVVQIDGSFPASDIHSDVATWIATGTASAPKAYFQSSQDFGCFLSNCADTTFNAGTFENDYLGIGTLGPQDFSGGNNADMELVGVASDPVSGWVETYKAANNVQYWYNSNFELGFTNWIDAITPTSSATSIFTEPSSGNVVGVRNEGTGWKTAFLAYDYLGADFMADTSVATGSDPTYAWGITVANQAAEFLKWAGFAVSVERENDLIPDQFSISQNYPNPFNPSTTIKFAIPQTAKVVLKVYDVLGREVANLVNETKEAGNYTVNFDASKLASGMYIYNIQAGNFNVSKKMMLLK